MTNETDDQRGRLLAENFALKDEIAHLAQQFQFAPVVFHLSAAITSLSQMPQAVQHAVYVYRGTDGMIQYGLEPPAEGAYLEVEANGHVNFGCAALSTIVGGPRNRIEAAIDFNEDVLAQPT
jgi:hypothetical protein